MIGSSCKRLAKIKKKAKKNDSTDYQFLIGSMERESNKQNYVSNKIDMNKSSLKNTIRLVKSKIINSFDNHEDNYNQNGQSSRCNKIKLKNKQIPFFENVKILKSSRIQQKSLQSNFDLPKKAYQKNIEFSQNLKKKSNIQSSRNKKSSKLIQIGTDSLERKVQIFVESANQMFQDFQGESTLKANKKLCRKKCLLQSLGRQLLRQMRKNKERRALNKSVQVSNFSSYNSKTVNRQLSNSFNQKKEQTAYIRIIDELSEQNSKLSQLISQHERKNITMFIKMNESESKQMQSCKKYLSDIYDKYKLLQKSIIKQNKRCKELSREKADMQGQMSQLKGQTDQLRTQLQRLKKVLRQNSNETRSKLSEQDSQKTIFNFNLNQCQLKGTQDNYSYGNVLSVVHASKIQRSLITRRDKTSSCLGNHLKQANIKQNQLMSCSAITKTKNMKRKKQKVNLGISLKEQFDQPSQDDNNIRKQLQNTKKQSQNNNKQSQDNNKQPQSIKKQLQKTIKQLQNLKKQLQISNKQLENAKKQLVNTELVLNQRNMQNLLLRRQIQGSSKDYVKREQKVQRMQRIINEQLQQIGKLMQINSKITNQIKYEQNKPDRADLVRRQTQSSGRNFDANPPKLDSLTGMSQKPPINDKAHIHRTHLEAEYRIMALQAATLESIINQQ